MLGRGRGGRVRMEEGRAKDASSRKFRSLISAEDSTAGRGLSSPGCDFPSAPILHIPFRKQVSSSVIHLGPEAFVWYFASALQEGSGRGQVSSGQSPPPPGGKPEESLV